MSSPDPSTPTVDLGDAELRAVLEDVRKRLAANMTLTVCEESLAVACAKLLDDRDRLKRGELTPDEFQNLCHNLHEKPGLTPQSFYDGCAAFQVVILGQSEREQLLADRDALRADYEAAVADNFRLAKDGDAMQEELERLNGRLFAIDHEVSVLLPLDVRQGSVVDALRWFHAALEAERAKVEKLRGFVSHSRSCPKHFLYNHYGSIRTDCTCGLEAALKETES